MTSITRRVFLGGTLSVVAASYVHAEPIPMLYGDGIHDDTVAIQALFDRKPVNIVNDTITVWRSHTVLAGVHGMSMTGGEFRISRPIALRSNWNLPEITFNVAEGSEGQVQICRDAAYLNIGTIGLNGCPVGCETPFVIAPNHDFNGDLLAREQLTLVSVKGGLGII